MRCPGTLGRPQEGSSLAVGTQQSLQGPEVLYRSSWAPWTQRRAAENRGSQRNGTGGQRRGAGGVRPVPCAVLRPPGSVHALHTAPLRRCLLPALCSPGTGSSADLCRPSRGLGCIPSLPQGSRWNRRAWSVSLGPCVWASSHLCLCHFLLCLGRCSAGTCRETSRPETQAWSSGASCRQLLGCSWSPGRMSQWPLSVPCFLPLAQEQKLASAAHSRGCGGD